MDILNDSEEDFAATMAELDRIDKQHSWLHRCFPPGPTTCVICHKTQEEVWRTKASCTFSDLATWDDEYKTHEELADVEGEPGRKWDMCKTREDDYYAARKNSSPNEG